jgi:hypothetical protein
MNANELADDLWACFTKSDWEYVDEAVAMLRQQAAEIEALRAENKFFKDLMGDVEILRKAQEK